MARHPLGLPDKVRRQLIERSIQPRRRRLAELAASPEIERLAFCHTVPGIGTRGSQDKGELRPLFIIRKRWRR